MPELPTSGMQSPTLFYQETHFVAAYTSGDRVEYFSATQGKWLLGEAGSGPRKQECVRVREVTE